MALAISAVVLPSPLAAQTVEARVSGGTALLAGQVTRTLELTGGAEVRWPTGFGIAGGGGLLVAYGPHGIVWIDGMVHSERTAPRHGVSVFAATGISYPTVFEDSRRARPHVRIGANYWLDESRALLFEVAVSQADLVMMRVGFTFR